MKHVVMKSNPEKPVLPAVAERARKADKAFDLWLQRGLHKLYDSAIKEPVPEQLRRLIEEDRAR